MRRPPRARFARPAPDPRKRDEIEAGDKPAFFMGEAQRPFRRSAIDHIFALALRPNSD